VGKNKENIQVFIYPKSVYISIDWAY